MHSELYFPELGFHFAHIYIECIQPSARLDQKHSRIVSDGRLVYY